MTGLERRAWFTASKKHEFSRRSLFYNRDFAVPTAGRLKSNGPCLPSLPTRMGTADKKEKVTGPKLLKGSVPITPDKGIIKGARPGWSFGKEGRGEGSMRWASKCWGVYLLFVLLRFSFKCHTCMNSIWYNDILHYFKSAAKQQRTPSSPPGPGTPFLSQDHWCQKCLLCSSGISCKHKQICGNLSGHFTFYTNRTADLPEGLCSIRAQGELSHWVFTAASAGGTAIGTLSPALRWFPIFCCAKHGDELPPTPAICHTCEYREAQILEVNGSAEEARASGFGATQRWVQTPPPTLALLCQHCCVELFSSDIFVLPAQGRTGQREEG